MAAERARFTIAQKQPTTSHDGMILLRSYVPATLELSLVTDSDATGSDERTV